MRGAFLATAAAIAGTAMADVAHMRRHGHDSFHHRREAALEADATCGCTTEVITVWGPPTLVPIATPSPSPSNTVTSEVVTTFHSTSYSTVTVIATPSGAAPESESVPETPATPEVTLPTPGVTSFSSTGTYTIPATTLTVTESTTVVGATTTDLPSGTHTYGGVTTIVDRHTTVVCPYATVEPSGSTVTSLIRTTTYVCPTAGTYTIAPTTTYVPTSTVIVYPTPATITPGTYTQPAQTVTVTRENQIYVCPFTGQEVPTTAPVVPAPTAVPATTTAVPAAPSSSSSKPPAVPSGGAVSGQMGMTYSPYTNEGGCKDKAAVLSEVAHLKSKGFTHVRVYSTDCSSLEFIGEAARTSGLQLIIGVFIKNTGIAGAQDQVTDIAKWAQWDMVSLIVVGNEAIGSGFCDASSLAGFISSAKQTWQSAGYSGQVTTAETINIWQANSAVLCGAVDIIGANIHPFFNADVSASNAGKFVAQEFRALKAICPGKEVINLETGWPHGGEANGRAIPSAEEQAIAIKAIADEVGSMSVFFSYFDDLWKEPGAFGVERYWGCIDNFR